MAETAPPGTRQALPQLWFKVYLARPYHIMYFCPIHFTTKGEELERLLKLQKQEWLKKEKIKGLSFKILINSNLNY